MKVNNTEFTIRIDELNSGELARLFNQGMAEIMSDIQNPTRVTAAKRTLTLQIDIEPDETGSDLEVSLIAKLKLAPLRGKRGLMYVRGGQVIAASEPLEQLALPIDAPKALQN